MQSVSLRPLGDRLQRKFPRRQALERTVRTMLIIIPSPRVNLLLRILDSIEPVRIQALLAELPVKRLYRRVVRWFASTVEVHLYLMVVSPQVHLSSGELRSVVTGDPFGQPTRVLQTIHRRYNMLGPQTESHLDRQALSCEQIDDGQSPKFPTIRQLIGDKVHSPDFVRSSWRSLLLSAAPPIHAATDACGAIPGFPRNTRGRSGPCPRPNLLA
jgi:hypothetical protein